MKVFKNLNITKNDYKTLILSIVISVTILYIFSSNFKLYKVYGTSMENTIHSDDVLLVSLNSYNNKTPSYSDIVNIKYVDNNEEKFIVKRIIGVPGDILEITNNQIFLNSTLLEEPYIKNLSSSYFNLKVIIPENKYFVLGDNRDVSCDSRYFGLIDKTSIEGKVLLKFCILNKIINTLPWLISYLTYLYCIH